MKTRFFRSALHFARRRDREDSDFPIVAGKEITEIGVETFNAAEAGRVRQRD